MKKYLFFAAIALCTWITGYSAPGDSTWVQANNSRLTWYGTYDSTVVFPPTGKTYRSIYMIFTLGKYMCAGYDPANAGATGWCGDWDYTVLNYLITPSGNSYEIGRLITPYANALNPRTPWAATQHYVYDVTDYAPLLHDTAKMRILFSGYSGGFTGNIKFLFIEGAPDREVVGIKRLWTGSYSYGDTSHFGTRNINLHFPTITDVAPDAAESAELKFTVTGHGSDPNYCNEFCAHSYYVFLNGAIIDSYRIWRPNCGSNELYPQSGTWIYERANWCPGAMVYSEHHKLPGVVGGSTPHIGLQFENYIGNGGASYTTEGILFYYGALKKTLDASIDGIISPNMDDNYFRENPICGNPVIHIKNRGAARIHTIVFSYGVKDSVQRNYTWTGDLGTFDETDVTLPRVNELSTMAGDSVTHHFTVSIVSVNGLHDADATNNSMTSSFMSAPHWPTPFKFFFRTNGEALASNPSICETNWIIYDRDGNIVRQRVNNAINTLFIDTLALPAGFYKLALYDSSCDGLQWWNSGSNAGSFFAKNMSGVNLPMNGYNYTGTYNNDWGCEYTQYFYVTGNPNQVAITNDVHAGMDAYPNPAKDYVNVAFTGLQQVNGRLEVIDALGRIVTTSVCTMPNTQINTSGWATGVYTVSYTDNRSGNKLVTRLLIAR